MSNFVTSLLLAIGGGTWIFYRFQRSSGGNAKNSAIGAAICAFILFVVMWIVLATFFKTT